VTVLDVRRVNRAQILGLLFFNGPLTRTVLGQSTGLSVASIASVLGDLMDERLIVEAGTDESEGGRPRVRLAVNPGFGTVIGVDIAQWKTSVGAFDLSMSEIGRTDLALHPAECGPEAVISSVAEAIGEVMAQLPPGTPPVFGVGVGVPGPVFHGEETLVYARNVAWDGVPVTRRLRDAVGLPVFVENRVRTFGQAEMWFGAGRGTSNTTIVLLNTGTSAAIFVDGSLYQGATWTAGEWGHTTLVADGRPCSCGGRGCISAYLGGGALIEQWAASNNEIHLPPHYDGEEWLDRFLAAVPEDRAAARLLEQTARYLGLALANIVNFLNPERIVIGGWVGHKLGPDVLAQARHAMEAQVFRFSAESTPVEFGQLGPDASALGASTLVVAELLANGGRAVTYAETQSPFLAWQPHSRQLNFGQRRSARRNSELTRTPAVPWLYPPSPGGLPIHRFTKQGRKAPSSGPSQ
jgi:predicted NBD/HSP70 family sugar kinase